MDTTSKAINLRAALAKLMQLKPAPAHRMFWFEGGADSYKLPAGWRSIWVSVDGSVKCGPDPLEAYTTSLALGVEKISFAATPGAGVSVGIFAERKVQA